MIGCRILFSIVPLASVASSFHIAAKRNFVSSTSLLSAMAAPLDNNTDSLSDTFDGGNTASNNLTPYQSLLCRLYTTNLFNAKTEGLKNMDLLHQAIGSPMDKKGVSIVHVAGSNGKGSTALKIAHTLKANYRVGMFSSPHISSFRERVQINGVSASKEQIQTSLQEVFDICDTQNIPATFFEVVTAMAFKIFEQEKVQVVVLETGLGGRLDATNVIKKPVLSIITSIGLEHTHILGDTIEKIALEKGGIIKEGCPVLVGKNVPVDVLKCCAVEKKASAFYQCDDILEQESKNDEGTLVDYDAENSRTATAALTLLNRIWGKESSRSLSTEQIEEGVKVRPLCRFEEIAIDNSITNDMPDNAPLKVILDVAHNPQAIEYLIAKLRSNYPSSPLRIVVGMSADKDLKSCSEIILKNVSHPKQIHLVESPNPRAASVASILDANPDLKECHHEETSVTLQVRQAMKLAAYHNELLVICGSFFIMADARMELGITEPRDSSLIVEETTKIIQQRQTVKAADHE